MTAVDGHHSHPAQMILAAATSDLRDEAAIRKTLAEMVSLGLEYKSK